MSKQVINVLVVLIAISLSGCAKRVLMKYAEPDAINECEKNFYDKFRVFLNEDEKKKLREIKTLSECQDFISEFWNIRDTDPTTQENEFKNLLEKRAADIQNEALFRSIGTIGFSFKNNGDFTGDPAKVYMLYGPPNPNYTEMLNNGRTFVDLMLWVYLDERGHHKYRFLFYHKNGLAHYVLFRPGFDIVYGLEEINKNRHVAHPLEVYNELERMGKYIFLLSLVRFSDDYSLNVDKVLRPPKPASEIAKELAPKISGELPEKEKVEISNGFGSLIPAEFSYEITNENLILKISVRHENLDWILKNDELTAELFVKITAWNETERHEEEQTIDIISTKEKIEEKKSVFIFETNPIKFGSESTRVSVYIKNNQKYNSWIEEIKR